MKPFVQILLINMGTVKYDPSYKKSLLHVHLSTHLITYFSTLVTSYCHQVYVQILLETLYASHSLFYLDFHFYHLIGNTEPYLTEVNLCFSFAGLLSRSVVSDSFRACGLQPTRILCPKDSPGKNPEVGCHALLQGIFLTQGSNPCVLCLLHCQACSLRLVPSVKPLLLFYAK